MYIKSEYLVDLHTKMKCHGKCVYVSLDTINMHAYLLDVCMSSMGHCTNVNVLHILIVKPRNPPPTLLVAGRDFKQTVWIITVTFRRGFCYFGGLTKRHHI